VLFSVRFLLLVTLFACATNSSKNKEEEVIVFYDSLDSLWSNKEMEEAISRHQAYLLQHSIRSGVGRIKNDLFIISKLDYEREYSKAMEIADELISFLENNTKFDRDYLVEAYYQRGHLSFRVKDYLEGMKFCAKGHNLGPDEKKDCRTSYYLHQLSSLLFHQRNYKESYKYSIEAFESGLSCPVNNSFYFTYTQGSLNTAGLSQEKMGNYDKAIDLYWKALDFIDSTRKEAAILEPEVIVAKGVVYGNLGHSYFLAGDLSKGELYLKESIKLVSPYQEYQTTKAYSSIKLANLYLAKKDISAVKVLLEDIENDVQNLTEIPEVLNRWSKLMVDYANILNDREVLLEWYPKYITAREKRYSEQLAAMEIDHGKELERILNEEEIKYLKDKNTTITNYLILAAIGIFLFLLVLGLFWWQSSITRKNFKSIELLNDRLQNQNDVLNKSMQALESAHEDNTKMLRIVAHDLRNPIAGVINMSDLLLSESNINEEQRSILEIIKKSSLDSLEFIRDLLNFNNDLSQLKTEPLKFNKLIEDCLKIIRHRAIQKQQDFQLQLESVMVLGNREKLWRVISNIISNAIKFSPIKSKITISTSVYSDFAILKIKDEGIGIPQDWNGELFKTAHKFKRSGTNGEPSYGLGLAISKQIIEAHKGSIWYESSEGKGTTFFISLPIYVPEESSLVIAEHSR
jgi:signal transduction histidine kinase